MCSEPVMRAPFRGFCAPYSFAQRHQARHFGLGDLDFLPAPCRERNVLDLEIGEVARDLSGHDIAPVLVLNLPPRPHNDIYI